MHLKDLKKGVATGSLAGHTDVNNNVVLGQGQANWPEVFAGRTEDRHQALLHRRRKRHRARPAAKAPGVSEDGEVVGGYAAELLPEPEFSDASAAASAGRATTVPWPPVPISLRKIFCGKEEPFSSP